MPSFADSIFLFVLALLLFGPKRLPMLARELGKWMGEFRRASNEFKMQMEDELRASEQADRQKQIAAMEAAAPIPPPLGEPAEPEHPHMRHSAPEPSLLAPDAGLLKPEPASPDLPHTDHPERTAAESEDLSISPGERHGHEPETVVTPTADGVRPVPIATSGSLNMMPPATGLPTARSRGGNGALASLVDSIPEAPANGEAANAQHQTESIAHGD